MGSFFTAMNVGASALSAAGIGVRTVGHNIANAADKDYTRQRVLLESRLPDQTAKFKIGSGVDVAGIERVIDQQLESLLRDSRADVGTLSARQRALSRLELVFDELDGGGLSGALSSFFDAAENLVNHPEDIPARRLFVTAGETLAETFALKDKGIQDLRRDVNFQVKDAVREINEILTNIADINRQILFSEKGGENRGQSNDLRDRRDHLMKELSDLVDVKVTETSSGTFTVSSGSDLLVEGTEAAELELDGRVDDEILVFDVRIGASGKMLKPRSGTLHGLLEARDSIIPGFRNDLGTLAGSVIFEVNKIHTGGEALLGFSDMTSEEEVSEPDAVLNQAGLPFPPQTGSFDLQVKDRLTGLVKTYNIRVDLDGLNGDDTTLQDLVAAINTAAGSDFPDLQATMTFDRHLRIASSNSAVTFSFADDTSHVLASLGVGTFFTGSVARDMAVSERLVDDPRLVATGQGDGPLDARNIAGIASLRHALLLQEGSATFEEFLQGIVGVLGVRSAEARDLLENQAAIQEHLENERAAFSGVNIDEEAIELIKFQRVFQGAARYLSVVDSLLDTLINAI